MKRDEILAMEAGPVLDALMAEELSRDSDLVLLKPINPLQLRTLASRLTS